jgi:hypothetical protein
MSRNGPFADSAGTQEARRSSRVLTYEWAARPGPQTKLVDWCSIAERKRETGVFIGDLRR